MFKIGDVVLYINQEDSFINSTHLVKAIFGKELVCIQLTNATEDCEYRIGRDWLLQATDVRKLTKLEKALK